MTALLMKISDYFPNMSKEFPKLPRRPDEGSQAFSDNLRKFLKISEEDSNMFRWYTNEFKYNLRDKLDINEIIDIFTCEDIVSSLLICYHWLLYNNNEIRLSSVLLVRFNTKKVHLFDEKSKTSLFTTGFER